MMNKTSILSSDLQQRCLQSTHSIPDTFLLVTIASRQLFLMRENTLLRQYVISTSQYGTGNAVDSLKTPTGIHRIIEKIGDGAPPGRIFKDRIDTGVTWRPGMQGENLVLTRILRLEGLEPGINRGWNIDTFERYIYIHGTNKEELIGTPLSHGCICMRNSDIMELYDAVWEGVLVIID